MKKENEKRKGNKMAKIRKHYLAKADDPMFTEGYSVVSLRKPVKRKDEKKPVKKVKGKKKGKK